MHADGLMLLWLSLTRSHFQNAMPRDYFLWLQSWLSVTWPIFECNFFPFFFFCLSAKHKDFAKMVLCGWLPPKARFSQLQPLSFPKLNASLQVVLISHWQIFRWSFPSVHGVAPSLFVINSFHTTNLANLNSNDSTLVLMNLLLCNTLLIVF